MSVLGSTRRDRVRTADGSRVDLPGGMPSTGLGAIAAVAAADGADPTSPSTLTDAARSAVYMDPITPHVEARVLVQSTREVPGAYVNVDAPTDWQTLTQPLYSGPLLAAGRDDVPPFGVFCLDVHRLDSQASTLTPSLLGQAGADELPWVLRPTGAPLARAVAGAAADVDWSSVGAATDENIAPNGSFTNNVAKWAPSPPTSKATFTRVATGGAEDGGAYGRLQAVTAVTAADMLLRSSLMGPVQPGQTVSARVAVMGTPGQTLRVTLVTQRAVPDGTQTTPLAQVDVTLTASWQVVTIPATVFPHAAADAVQLWIEIPGFAALAAGTFFAVDRVKVRRGAAAGTYVDGASTGGRWLGVAHESASVIAATSGTYARVSDPTAPALGLAGTLVHRRTGALTPGVRLWSPGTRAQYRLQAGRQFTAAGWVRATSAGTGVVTLRWVLELVTEHPVTMTGSAYNAATVHVLRSEPFSVRPGAGYVRVARPLTLPSPWETGYQPEASRLVRLSLEVVAAPTGDTSASTLSLRGAHAYAGAADRGDLAGLSAVVVPTYLAITVGAPPGLGKFRVNRVDVHGHDTVGQVTAASVRVVYDAGSGVTRERWASDASTGRLTVRMPSVPDSWLSTTVVALVEEVDGGPGAAVALQAVVGWNEVDATGDVASLAIERASDADPADSTVPVGNFAAATCRLVLDDPAGDWSLFRRAYLTLGHRLEVATGFVYTNRVGDPGGVRTRETGRPSVTYPVGGTLVTGPDVHGQTPPAPFSCAATGASARVHAAAPVVEGWTMRGRVWVRLTGPGTVAITWGGGGVAVDGSSSVVAAGAGRVTVPMPGPSGVWWLVQLPAVTIPAAETHALVTAQVSGGAAGTVIEVAAPDLERLHGGDVVEVVETAPAGVFYTTSWDDDAASQSVNVAAVDVLGARGRDDLLEDVRADTTVEQEFRRLARRYLSLGSDQVIFTDTAATSLPYAIPAPTVGEQLADLAKAAGVTVHTDGAGRLVARLLQDTPAADTAVTYQDTRSLVDARTAVTYDVVRNDAQVTAHPTRLGLAGTELAVVGRKDPVVLPLKWAPTSADIPVAPGQTLTLEVPHDPAVGQAWSLQWVDGSIPLGANLSSLNGIAEWPSTSANVVVTHLSDRTRFELHAPAYLTAPLWVLRIHGTGRPVITDDVTITRSAPESIARFGRRPVEVDVRLAQSAAQAVGIGDDVLSNYSLVSDGVRWLPDLDADVLFDPWREVGDRVVIASLDGPSGEYRVIRHTLEVGTGGASSLYLRQIRGGLTLFVLGTSTLGGSDVLTY